MLNLFLTTIFSVSLFVFFRVSPRFRINSFHAIVCNYFICTIIAVSLNDIKVIQQLDYTRNWILLSMLTGAMFPLSFYLMALAIEKVNLSVAGVANKMSMVIPVTFNFMFLQIGARDMKALNIIGICLALPAIFLASFKPSEDILMDKKTQNHFILPLLVFLTAGIIDSLINYISYYYLTSRTEQLLFPIFTFVAAALVGSLIVAGRALMKNESVNMRSVTGGIILGIPNFLSIFFMLKTLNDFNNDGAVVFPFLNITVIILTSLSGLIFFKEKLSRLNIAGIILALISIGLVFLNWELFLKQINSIYSDK
ncbi:MAG TPA: DMT family transporter [Cytophagaceae bacterium]|jgi:drug/metabolite transporter (DMT)-like permease|nr:DMT family transporter [Cytophagaceae bacterium]